MIVRGTFLTAVIVVVLFSFSFSYGESPQITSGLNYLTQSQNPDGSWGNTISTTDPLPSTVSVIETLQQLNLINTASYSNSLLWLQTQGIYTTGYLSERIHAFSVAGTDNDLLLSYIEPLSYAWGGYDDYETNNLDTALALQALKRINYLDQTIISSALGYLTATQNRDGGWGFCLSTDLGCADGAGDSNVYMTAIVVDTLTQFKVTYNLTPRSQMASPISSSIKTRTVDLEARHQPYTKHPLR